MHLYTPILILYQTEINFKLCLTIKRRFLPFLYTGTCNPPGACPSNEAGLAAGWSGEYIRPEAI